MKTEKKKRYHHHDDDAKEEDDDEEEPITFVEFYAGVGGWSMALSEAVVAVEKKACSDASPKRRRRRRCRLERLAALDHSDLCLRVLEHNNNVPSSNGSSSSSTNRRRQRQLHHKMSIERLSLGQVEEWNATIWAMSPPCQPHTRQHDNQGHDMADPRSHSFLHLCSLLEEMNDSKLPKLLLMENVVGFETSNSCQRWRRVLLRRKYKVAHFHLNPTQVGIPNDRPRYYAVAVREVQLQLQHPTTATAAATATLAVNNNNEHQTTLSSWSNDFFQMETMDDVRGLLLPSPPRIQTSIVELGVVPLNDEATITTTTTFVVRPLSDFLDHDHHLDDDEEDGSGSARRDAALRVPNKILNSQASWCFDIVTPNDRRSACFTQSYGKFVRGTGSVLYQPATNDDNGDCPTTFALVPPEERQFKSDWADGLSLRGNLRYFSGRELAKLFGFDENFSFPSDCSLRQQWKLMGNSLNVTVAAKVAELGCIQCGILR